MEKKVSQPFYHSCSLSLLWRRDSIVWRNREALQAGSITFNKDGSPPNKDKMIITKRYAINEIRENTKQIRFFAISPQPKIVNHSSKFLSPPRQALVVRVAREAAGISSKHTKLNWIFFLLPSLSAWKFMAECFCIFLFHSLSPFCFCSSNVPYAFQLAHCHKRSNRQNFKKTQQSSSHSYGTILRKIEHNKTIFVWS